jgi:GT2 family glycosyltransferase
VIPNYNGKELLATNLPFVYEALKTSNISDFEIIIPDDASSDGSTEFVRTNYPDIILIVNPENKGFSGNTNSGLSAAKKELVFILNSDVQLTKNYFTPLLPYFDKEDTFGVGGRIVAMDSDKIQDAAKYPVYSFGNIISTKNYLFKERQTCYSFFLSGANALIDRKKMLELGLYNELFNPYYNEDVDLGLRAWRLGYKLYYEHSAICRHPNSATIKKEPSKKVKIISKRNRMILHYVHLDGIELFYYQLKTIIKSYFRLVIGDASYMASYKQFRKMKPSIISAKVAFKQLQVEKKTFTKTREVALKILKSIENKDVDLF